MLSHPLKSFDMKKCHCWQQDLNYGPCECKSNVTQTQHTWKLMLKWASAGQHGVVGSIPTMGATHFSVLSDMVAIFQVK